MTMRSGMRPRKGLAFCGVVRGLAVLLILLVAATHAASAGDFILNYAIDVIGNTDAGKIESCLYDEPCDVRSSGLNIKI